MKYIAHRGASVERQENTLDSLILAAHLGAYACECDIRKTADGVFVLFHDQTLERFTGTPDLVEKLTARQMCEKLEAVGCKLTLFSELKSKDFGDSFVLCDIGNDYWECNDRFFQMLAESSVRVICGVHAVKEARLASKYFPPEQILAFMQGDTVSLAVEFQRAGAGIIRLWENWLDHITPADVKKGCEGVEVWIMSNHPKTRLDGSEESLLRLQSLGADGVLLNDIRMACEFGKRQENR